jgi:hypothetical protein
MKDNNVYEVKLEDGMWVVYQNGCKKDCFLDIRKAAVLVDDLRREERKKSGVPDSANSNREEATGGNK